MLKKQVYKDLLLSEELTDLVGNNIYSRILKKRCHIPAITYSRVVDTTEQNLKGLDKEKARFQFSLYGKSEEQCEELLHALKKTLEHKAVFLSAVDGYEHDTRLFSIKVDYSISKRN